jgi:hypothetical protein
VTYVTPASEVAGSVLPFTVGIGLFGNSELLPTLLARYPLPSVFRLSEIVCINNARATDDSRRVFRRRSSEERTTDKVHPAHSADNGLAHSSAAITGSDAIDAFAQGVGQSAPFQNRRPRSKNAETA